MLHPLYFSVNEKPPGQRAYPLATSAASRGENWGNINASLRQGTRGHPGRLPVSEEQRTFRQITAEAPTEGAS